jgi:hypothetical protein
VLKVQYPARGDGLSLWEKTEGGLEQHWRRPYVDRVWPPHRAYVTHDGKYVVLRDVYHNLGHGKVIVILGENGEILGSYELRHLLPQEEIRSAIHTVSSICWNDNAWFSFINDDQQFALVTQHGTVCCFDMPTGKMLDLSDEEHAKIVDLVRREAEAWVESEAVASRVQGITLLGALGFKEAVPVAMKLFQDRTVTGSVGRSVRPRATTHHVQKAAALALVRLLGAEAIPIIERELSEANWHMKEELMKVLTRLDTKAHDIVEMGDSKAAREVWKRLAEHPSDDIRYPALRQVLLRDDGAYLLEHSDLVECNDDRVRRTAIDLLSKMSFPEALPLLQRAVRESVRSSLKPPDDDAKRRRR